MTRIGGVCTSCGGMLDAAHDPGDDFPEVWCPAERACEAPGCRVSACGDDMPQPCAVCGFRFCPAHLANLADENVCTTCERGLVP